MSNAGDRRNSLVLSRGGVSCMQKEQKRWMTIDEVASYLRVSKRTIQTWLSEGMIPCVRLPGRFVRFDQEAVDEWARSLAVPAMSLARRRRAG